MNLKMAKVVEGGSIVREKSTKNRFQWEWVSKEVGEVRIGNVICKIEKEGHVHCIVCRKDVKYGSAGLNAIRQHMTRPKHLANYAAVSGGFTIAGK